jgi:catechol 2,3-dioxygenase-like lactoylglutathione lyase family enzyme
MLAIRNWLFIRDRRGDERGQMEVNGIAQIFLTASNFERSREFYRKLLPFLGVKPVIDSDTIFYCVGGRTAVGINAPVPEHAGAAFEQNRVARRDHHSRAPRGSMGAGILFAAVRGSRRNKVGAQSCSGERASGVTGMGIRGQH